MMHHQESERNHLVTSIRLSLRQWPEPVGDCIFRVTDSWS